MPECLPLLAALLAQDPTAGALSGASPYLGAGILSGVLGWLLFVHLPGKDKQLKELLTDKDTQFREMLERERENSKEMAKEFREAMERVALNCQTEMTKMAGAWQAQMTNLTAATDRQIASVVKAMEDLATVVNEIRWPPRDNFGAPVKT